MSCHGSAHFTNDLDLFCARDPANLSALAAALAPLCPNLLNGDEAERFHAGTWVSIPKARFSFEVDAGAVDLLLDLPGFPFAALCERSQSMELLGTPVQVASLDDLIAMKRAAGRIGDRIHLLELERLRVLLAERARLRPDGG